jgi:serine/threonine-protein kinase
VVTDVPAERKTVSRSAFHAALFALLLVGALAVYGLFFHRSVVGSANSKTETFRDEDSMAAIGAPNTVMATKKKMTTVSNKEKKAKSDSLAKAVLHAKKEQPALAKNSDSAATTDEAVPGHTQAASDNNDNQKGDDGEAVRYKVRGKAYFHDEPDASTKRDAFITHWNNAVLTPLDEKNGFVYIVFTNHLGQTSKGWIAKDDLIAIK